MGRAPCCDKDNVKKGPWSPEEDAKLKAYIEQHGTGGNWIALPQKIGLKRCGKSCRLRWLNYLRPNIKHGGFSEEEDHIICSLYVSIGSRWSIIASQLPGRTDNDIKNYWNTRLKKKLLGKQRKDQLVYRPKKEREIPTSVIVSSNQNIIAQQYPAPAYLNHQEPTSCFVNDHTSIRKLLSMLGGKFCADEPNNSNIANSNIVNHTASHDLPTRDNSTDVAVGNNYYVHKFSACSSVPSSSSSSSMLPGAENNYYGTKPPKLMMQDQDGLELSYADDQLNTSTKGSVFTCTGESMVYDWGDHLMNQINEFINY